MDTEGFNLKNFLSPRNLIILFAALTFINLAYLDLISSKASKQIVLEKSASTNSPSNNSQSLNKQIDQMCPQSCVSQIYEATASHKLTSEPTPTTAEDVSPTPTVVTNATKEFFVPLGQGSSSADDWQDVPTIQATIDTANYPDIKSATFEVSFRIPTGNEIAYIRLYNTTDKHPVWTSELSLEGGTPKFLTKAITLEPGSKTYQVQMKTSLKFQAIFDQARLHIITY